MFLKTLQYWSHFLIINLLLQSTYGGCFWIFVAANTFLQLNMVFIAHSRTGSEAATRGVLLRKGVLRHLAKLTGKHKCQSLFFNKVKEGTLAQVLFCEFLEISKSTFFTKHLQTTASAGFCSGLFWKQESNLRSSHWSCSVKKVFLENLQISQENNCIEVSF